MSTMETFIGMHRAGIDVTVICPSDHPNHQWLADAGVPTLDLRLQRNFDRPGIARLREEGIRISAVGGELEVDAPGGRLTPELRAELVARKSELLRLLSWSRRSSRSEETPLVPVARDKALPLSWAQQRL